MHLRVGSPPAVPSLQQLQSRVDADRARLTTPDDDGFTLRPRTESFCLTPTAAPKGIVVMYHGFTDGPWQCRPLASKFQSRGYVVYAPRLPGHGMQTADRVPTHDHIPTSRQREQWDRFVDSVFNDAASTGLPVSVVGLSGGGNCAMRTAERHPEVRAAAVMAPFLGPDAPKGIILPVVNVLDTITLGLVGRALDKINWAPNINTGPEDLHPKTQPTLGQALRLEQLGRRIRHVPCPVQVITVDHDRWSGIGPVRRVARRIQPEGWHHFRAGEGVEHSMLDASQQKSTAQGVERVHDIVLGFIDEGRASNRA